MSDQLVEQAIALAHAKAQQAYHNRDLGAYMDSFAMDLAYRQPDGSVIGRDRLSADVADQFKRMIAAASVYKREAIRTLATGVEEDLVQQAWACTTIFGCVHRTWHIERRGTYTWSDGSGRWRIKSVNVRSERVISSSWFIGRTPQPPFGPA